MGCTREDLYSQVTAGIVKAIEAGAGRWQMPWHPGCGAANRPVNVSTGAPYRGVNAVSLWSQQASAGFSGGHWGTYRQWQAQGCQVRAGARGSPVVFYTQKPVRDDTLDRETGRFQPVMRVSRVFHQAQVIGWEPPVTKPVPAPVVTTDRVGAFIAKTQAVIHHRGDQAYYSLNHDWIVMPPEALFFDTDSGSAASAYQSTLLHELVHWTGHPTRCDRQFGRRFGDQAYAMEELVAELGAAFLCADLEISLHPRPDHAAYLKGWLRVLKQDSRAIFVAARQATLACTWLHGDPVLPAVNQPSEPASELASAVPAVVDGGVPSQVLRLEAARPEYAIEDILRSAFS